MAIHQTGFTVDYRGNGTSDIFPIPFWFATAASLVVTSTTDAGVETTLVLDTDYTVTGAAGKEGRGFITLDETPEDDVVITITRDTPITQLLDLSGATYSPAAHEGGLDKLTAIFQELSALVDADEARVEEAEELDIEDLITATTLALFKMEAVSGSTIDETVTYNLTTNGTPLSVAGHDGNGYEFDTNIRLSQSSFTFGSLMSGALRVSMWIKANLPLTFNGCLILISDSGKHNNSNIRGALFKVFIETNGRITLNWDATGAGSLQGATTVDAVPDNVWCEVVCTRYPSGLYKIEIDGVEKASGLGTPIAWSPTPTAGCICISGASGLSFGPNSNYIGCIDEVLVERLSL